jgi:hypothetical protein
VKIDIRAVSWTDLFNQRYTRELLKLFAPNGAAHGWHGTCQTHCLMNITSSDSDFKTTFSFRESDIAIKNKLANTIGLRHHEQGISIVMPKPATTLWLVETGARVMLGKPSYPESRHVHHLAAA